MRIPARRALAVVATAALATLAAPAYAAPSPTASGAGSRTLAPRTWFTMAPDGSSGLTQGGAGIPNIDSVKKTIATYYADPGTGIANKQSSPYISEMKRIERAQWDYLTKALVKAHRHHTKPAIVFDADDTTLMTYDMEVGAMKFVYDPVLQDEWVQHKRFPATPGMVGFVNRARALGFTIFGLTGRNDDQKTATVANLKKVGYDGFTPNRFFTKWTGVGSSQQPSYITCATSSCTTVEFKAGTRKHIEKDLGYDIVLNVGDQWSDLMGGYADKTLKLPNPTYYLPSPDLPGLHEPKLTPRTHFRMAPDGSSGATESGEGIPNIDSVKATIRTYYGDTGNGIANKTASPYITEMTALTAKQTPIVAQACRDQAARGKHPAVVFDADDTTLMTYDMEVGAMKFVYDPVLQNEWVQDERFPATPGMVSLVNAVADAGCTVFGLTGRNDDQKEATLGNLGAVGYHPFTVENYYTKWTGVGPSQQPPYITCKTSSCTTVEYKSQTRAHIETLGYRIVANFGDQFSDLLGGSSNRAIKLPNPTYYLP